MSSDAFNSDAWGQVLREAVPEVITKDGRVFLREETSDNLQSSYPKGKVFKIPGGK